MASDTRVADKKPQARTACCLPTGDSRLPVAKSREALTSWRPARREIEGTNCDRMF